MALCDIRQKVSGCEDLAGQIEQIADRVIPVLEDITGLPVGPRPVIRLLAP